MSGKDTGETLRAGRHTVRLNRPDKVLFPDDGLTKAGLVAYYRRVAPLMLPHLRGRPLMLELHPDGLGGGTFMQKEIPAHYPQWIHRAQVGKEGGTVTHVLCDDTATLLHLAAQACVTPHRWLARADRPHHPDRLVFDLDPSGDDFEAVREAATWLGELLDQLRLPFRLMTTGSRGLHAVVPLDRSADTDEVRAFARDAADLLAARHPGELTTAARKTDRGDRLYLDIQRNGYAQTAVAPYAVRALPGAPVAAPISRDDLADGALTARRWTAADAGDLVRADPWKDTLARGRSLGPARRRLDRLTSA